MDINYLLAYIETRKNTLLHDNDLIPSMYRSEIETAASYDGRQLLEMLQNADDAKSSTVRIILDTKAQLLEIANVGTPFDDGGIESIMLAHKSPKSVDRAYIGNKGLGFRSVISWATEVEIITRWASFLFSKTQASDFFDELVKEEKKVVMKADSRVRRGEAPFPMLALPFVDVSKKQEGAWETTIRLKYEKKVEGSILKQMEDLRPEILLFLNSIRSLELCHDGVTQVLKCDEVQRDFRIIEGKKWLLSDSGDVPYPEEPGKFYRFILAYQEDLADDYYRLFTYFPTKVLIHLPLLIHATFELDPARNGLNDSAYNRDLLKKLAAFIGKTALDRKRPVADWRVYRMVNPLQPPGSDILKELYSGLAEIRNEKDIYPCVDGTYRKLDEVKHYSVDFAQWIAETGYLRNVPELLLADKEGMVILRESMFRNRRWQAGVLKQKIDGLSAALRDQIPGGQRNWQERKDLTDLLLDPSFSPYPPEKFSLFVNEAGRVIPSSEVAYTPVILGENVFSKPSFVGIELMNRELYQLLVTQHKAKFAREDADVQESRQFKNYFEKLVNIQPYDINTVLLRIIAATRSAYKKAQGLEAQHSIIREAIQSLFDNYKRLRDPAECFSDSCPVLTKKGEIKESSEVLLSNAYPSGQLTEQIYAGVLNGSDYLGAPEQHGLQGDGTDVEAFFVWLGVNRYVRLEPFSFESKTAATEPYLSYLLVKKVITDEAASFSLKGEQISAFRETIARLSAERILQLVLSDPKIRARMEVQNEDKLTQVKPRHVLVPNKPSYINYQLESLGRFSNYVADHNELLLLNDKTANLENFVFNGCTIATGEVQHILHRLGAKLSFDELLPNQVYHFIARCGQECWTEAQAKKLYQLCFNYFRKRTEKEEFPIPSYKLLAEKENETGYIDRDLVYYSDNATLPSHLAQTFWMFEFPKRRGEDQVSGYFGTKTFKNLHLQRVGEAGLHQAAPDFESWVERIKPFVLAFRLADLNDEKTKKTTISQLKSLRVQLVSGLAYSINSSDTKPLQPGEFIQLDDDVYYLCAAQGLAMAKLKEEPAIGAAFAEIICVLFKVNESYDTYQAIFNDSESLKHTRFQIQSRKLGAYLVEARKWLGLSSYELSFWTAVLSWRNTTLPSEVEKREVLHELIKQTLSYLPAEAAKADYEAWSTQESYALLKELSLRSKISPEQIREKDAGFMGLRNWHYKRLCAYIADFEKPWTLALWKKLKDVGTHLQKQFMPERLKYNKTAEKAADELAAENALAVDVDYKIVLRNRLSEVSGLVISFDDEPDIFCNLYTSVLAEAGVSEEDLPEELQSLLYFTGYDEEIRKGVFALRATSGAGKTEENKGKGTTTSVTLNEVSFGAGTPRPFHHTSKKANGETPRVYNSSSAEQQNVAGKAAERLVRDKLIELYPNGKVQWRSRYSDEDALNKDDTLGYDIEYKCDSTDDEWYLVEVKSASGENFIISRNEVMKGIEKKDRYQIAIVQNGVIYLDKHYFLSDDRIETFKALLGNPEVLPLNFEVSFTLPR
ncbi:DUF3883 domain-containing protein [Paracnuella aquatica]|uniref:DUF3883 domain-containing protein n=1 Tax=Paracnuella aquatica TaxID=2268757 RepID=UPI000DF01C88|nr:DUF3883 domain-containing protein [Paracnuella aquatica]RPD44010.1 DUF3883 domain-containing protein [Paracnuella aquatica]